MDLSPIARFRRAKHPAGNYSPTTACTGRATGGFRAQFATPINVQISLMSRDALLRFNDETGVDPGFQQVGYLWLASSSAEMQAVHAANRLQHAEGLTEARVLDRDGRLHACGDRRW